MKRAHLTAVISLGLSLYLGTANRAESFAPKNWVSYSCHGGLEIVPAGAVGSTHQSITEDALKELETGDYGTVTRAMERAIEDVVNANADVDRNQFIASAHFDGENFNGGQTRVLNLRAMILSAAKAGDYRLARINLGEALHSIQDFYAHCNWVELGNTQPHPDLGVPGHTIAFADISLSTCSGSTLANGGLIALTSGYYGGEDRQMPAGVAKCAHGGPCDSQGSDGISKDSRIPPPLPGASPHWNFHAAAGAVAQLATIKFIRELKPDLTQTQFDALLGADPLHIQSNNQTSTFTLDLYLDGAFWKTVTLTALKQTNLFLEDLGSGPHTLRLWCTFSASATGLAGYSLTLPSVWSFTQVKRESGTVTQLSGNTHSDLFIIHPASGPAHIWNEYTISAIRLNEVGTSVSNAVNIVSFSEVITSGTNVYPFPCDSTITSLKVSFVGTNVMPVSSLFDLRYPSGTSVKASDAGVAIQQTASGISYSINGPVAGSWTALVMGTNSYNIGVGGIGGITFLSLDFVTLQGRSGHQGYFAQSGQPLVNQTNTLHAALGDGFATAVFDFRNSAGAVLQPINLQRGSDASTNEFLGDVYLSGTPFTAYASGTDTNGNPFLRYFAQVISPQPISIMVPPAQNFYPGKNITYTFQVTNSADAFLQFSARDDRGYITSISPTNANMNAGVGLAVNVSLIVPINAPIGVSDVLTFTAQGATGTNSAQVLSGTALPPSITVLGNGTNVVLTWPDGLLETTDDLNKPWTLAPAAVSPYTITNSAPSAFFRLRL